MGAGGVPNRGIERVDGRRGDLPVMGGAEPRSRQDLYVDDKLVQSRWFDDEGRAERNRDYEHQDPKNDHTFPHDHDWSWEKGYPERIPENLDPDYDNYF